MSPTLVKCQNLDYQIGYKRIFKNLSFEIQEKEFWLLLGDNGSGKSTLLKLLYHGTHSAFYFPKKIQMSYVGHSLGLYSSLSLKENLEYFGTISHSKNIEKIPQWLETFRLKKRYLDPIHTFSEGMKKKSAIIRSLLINSELWLLDEPFNGLDQASVEELKKLLINFSGSILLATHNPEKFLSLATGEMKFENGNLLVRRYVESSY